MHVEAHVVHDIFRADASYKVSGLKNDGQAFLNRADGRVQKKECIRAGYNVQADWRIHIPACGTASFEKIQALLCLGDSSQSDG